MGSQILIHAGRQLAIGLQWSVHDHAKLARAHAKRVGAAYWLLASLTQREVTAPASSAVPSATASRATALACLQQKHSGALWCAAMAVGLVHPNAVVCQNLGHGKVWLCVIANGLPFPDQDRIVDAEQAPHLLHEVMGYASILIGDVAGANHSLADAWSELEWRRKRGQITRRALRATRLGRRYGWGSALLACAWMLAFGIAGLLGWRSWQAVQSGREGRLRALAQMAREQAMADQTAERRAQERKIHDRKVAQARAELALANPPSAWLWAAWNTARRQLPQSVVGYQPDQLSCDLNRCTASWSAHSPHARWKDRAQIPGVVLGEDPQAPLKSEVSWLDTASLKPPVKAWSHFGARPQAMVDAAQFIAPELKRGALEPLTLRAGPELAGTETTLGSRSSLQLQLQGPTALIRADEAVALFEHWPVRLLGVTWTQPASAQPGVQLQAEFLLPATEGRQP